MMADPEGWDLLSGNSSAAEQWEDTLTPQGFSIRWRLCYCLWQFAEQIEATA